MKSIHRNMSGENLEKVELECLISIFVYGKDILKS